MFLIWPFSHWSWGKDTDCCHWWRLIFLAQTSSPRVWFRERLLRLERPHPWRWFRLGQRNASRGAHALLWQPGATGPLHKQQRRCNHTHWMPRAQSKALRLSLPELFLMRCCCAWCSCHIFRLWPWSRWFHKMLNYIKEIQLCLCSNTTICCFVVYFVWNSGVSNVKWN